MTTQRSVPKPPAEQGSVAVPFAIALPVILGFMGLALDLANVYTRKTELQAIADGAALGAARQLNGTLSGVTAAKAEARKVAEKNQYQFKVDVAWNSAALSFSNTPDSADGDWKDADSIGSNAAAAGLSYAKVDTGKLGAAPGLVEATFIRVLAGAQALSNVTARAVAGAVSVQVTPLAVCAFDPAAPSGTRANPGIAGFEKLEYGFRRGVSYNLLDISPNSTTPRNYLVNPVDPGDRADNPAHYAAAVLKPFFCTGSVALGSVRSGSTVHVQPVAGLALNTWLNSRFDSYPPVSGCNPATAPSDSNVREYTGGYANWYMGSSPNPYPASAASTNRSPSVARVSFADLTPADTASATPTADSFGPVWAYSRAVPVGAGSYATTDWPKLYTFGGASVPVANAKYPPLAGVPYLSPSHTTAPSNAPPGLPDRRVLNIPLLNCAGGGPSAPATVLAVGRFFMTAKASASAVYGEFAGTLANDSPTLAIALHK